MQEYRFLSDTIGLKRGYMFAGLCFCTGHEGYPEDPYLVLPMLRKVKNRYPEDSDILFVLKYKIVSVVNSIEATIQVFEENK